jgi:hypothetical protein
VKRGSFRDIEDKERGFKGRIDIKHTIYARKYTC